MSHISPHASSDAGSENNYPTAWYTPPSTVAYSEAYMTPFPSSTFEMTPFPTTTAQWPTTQGYFNLNIPTTSMVGHEIERPRSSPSTFGPSANELAWQETPLGIRYPVPEPPQVLSSNGFLAQSYQHTPPQQDFTTPSPPRRSNSDAQRFYPTLAPNPAGVAAKRLQDDDEDTLASASKRRRRTPSNDSMEEENRVMLKLLHLPWKEITVRMGQQFGRTFEVAQLQMRWRRHPSRAQIWERNDVEALKQAHDWFEKNKWKIISEKMQDFDAEQKWPAILCSRKWVELSGNQRQRGNTTPPQQPTPTLHYASPPEHMTPGYITTEHKTPQYIPTTENLSHFPFMTL